MIATIARAVSEVTVGMVTLPIPYLILNHQAARRKAGNPAQRRGKRGSIILESEMATMPDRIDQLAVDPASASAVSALQDDPFYRSICAPYWSEAATRRAVLSQYFNYSIQEGRELGRSVHLADETCGVAVWLLPQSPEVEAKAARQKRTFLKTTLGAVGCANYYRIIEFMSAQSATLVDNAVWYLSIVAVDPVLQGQGLGRKLLEPSLAEADQTGATCYLETFGPQNLGFYRRLGYAAAARFMEPTTGANHTLMIRPPS